MLRGHGWMHRLHLPCLAHRAARAASSAADGDCSDGLRARRKIRMEVGLKSYGTPARVSTKSSILPRSETLTRRLGSIDPVGEALSVRLSPPPLPSSSHTPTHPHAHTHTRTRTRSLFGPRSRWGHAHGWATHCWATLTVGAAFNPESLRTQTRGGIFQQAPCTSICF